MYNKQRIKTANYFNYYFSLRETKRNYKLHANFMMNFNILGIKTLLESFKIFKFFDQNFRSYKLMYEMLHDSYHH